MFLKLELKAITGLVEKGYIKEFKVNRVVQNIFKPSNIAHPVLQLVTKITKTQCIFAETSQKKI